MNVLLVFNDGNIESFDTRDDMSQEYTHARLVTYVEEADDGDDRYEVGIELIPNIHSSSRDLNGAAHSRREAVCPTTRGSRVGCSDK